MQQGKKFLKAGGEPAGARLQFDLVGPPGTHAAIVPALAAPVNDDRNDRERDSRPHADCQSQDFFHKTLSGGPLSASPGARHPQD